MYFLPYLNIFRHSGIFGNNSGIFRTLVYSEPCNIQKPEVYSEPWHNQNQRYIREPKHIQNPEIFRTMAYSEPKAYLRQSIQEWTK